jgi:hypothetical protein
MNLIPQLCRVDNITCHYGKRGGHIRHSLEFLDTRPPTPTPINNQSSPASSLHCVSSSLGRKAETYKTQLNFN